MGQQNHVTSLLLLLFGLLLSSAPSILASTDPTYTFFLNCLKVKTQTNSTSSILFSKSSPGYTSALTSGIRNLRFSTPTTPKPLLILTPQTPSHVSAAVVCARDRRLQIKIRSGGHDFEGLSSTSSDRRGFLLLDLSNFRTITVDLPTKTARVGAGATLGELYYSIWTKSPVLAFPAGLCPTVGVGGHLAGGGYGTLIRKHGLSVDHIIDAQIVLSDGRILTRKTMGEDLFWAIRGGGGSGFGVILSYTVGLVAVPATVSVFSVMKEVDESVTNMVYTWQVVMKEVDDNLFMRVLLQPGGSKTTSVRVTFMGLYLGRTGQLIETMNREFPELGLKTGDCKEMSWAESVLYWYNYPSGTPMEVLLNRKYQPEYQKRKSDYIREPIPKAGLERLWRKLAEVGAVGMVFNSYGGRMSQIPADATPFPHRKGNLYKIQYSVSWKEGGAAAEDKYVGMAREVFGFMAEYASRNSRAAFLNYRDLDIGVSRNGTYGEGRVYGEKYFLGNFQRLVRVKTAVDPANFFRNEQSIPVLPS